MQAVSFRRHKLNICIMFKALHSHIWRVRQPCWDWVNGWEREQPFATTSALPARFHMARDLFLRLPEHGGQACALPRAWPRSHHCPHSTPRGFSFSLNIPPQVAVQQVQGLWAGLDHTMLIPATCGGRQGEEGCWSKERVKRDQPSRPALTYQHARPRRMFFLHQWPHQWRHCKIFIKTVPVVPLTHLLSGWKGGNTAHPFVCFSPKVKCGFLPAVMKTKSSDGLCTSSSCLCQ